MGGSLDNLGRSMGDIDLAGREPSREETMIHSFFSFFIFISNETNK